MIRPFLFALLMCCSLTNIAQPLQFSNKFAVKVTPSSLLDIEASQLPVGIEYLFAKKYGVGIQVSIPLKTFVFSNGETKVKSDMKYRIELRDYALITKKARYFFGVEAYYRKMELALSAGKYLMQNYDKTATDILGNVLTGGTAQIYSGDLVRTQKGVGLFFGSMTRIAGNFYFDWNIGIGFHFTNGTYSNMVKDPNQVNGPYGRLAPKNGLVENTYNIYRDGAYKMFYTPMALRLSYVIGGKK